MAEIEAVKSPKFSSRDGLSIDCVVKFVGRPEALPFTARGDDVEAVGRLIYARAMAGDYGVIAEFSDPVQSVDAKRAAEYARRGASVEALTVALWEYAIEGRTEPADALQLIRAQVKAEIPK